MEGVPTKPGMDRDESPPAVFAEGSQSVRHIPSTQNRGLGAVIGNQIRDVPDGGKVIIQPKPTEEPQAK